MLVWGVGAASSALFAWLALRGVSWGDAWRALEECTYWWLVPALALLVLTVPVKVARWRYLYRAETRPPLRPATDALLIGLFFNNILPARAGEAARVVALNRDAGTSRTESAATIVVERIFDVLGLLLMLFVALPWLPHVSWIHGAAYLAAGLAAAVVVCVAALRRFGDRPLRTILRPLSRLPFASPERVERVGLNALRGLSGVRTLRVALIASLLTLVSWLLLTVSTWFLMQGFGLHLPFLAGLLVVVAFNLALVLPSSPAGLGVFEAATLVALHAYDVPRAQAVSYALVLHLLNLVPYLAFGLILVSRQAARLRPVDSRR